MGSTTHTRRNGYAQGDSHAIQASLAMMTIWTWAVKHDEAVERVSDISTGGFLDDSNYRVQSLEERPRRQVLDTFLAAWQRSAEFDVLAGAETNTSKTIGFSTCQHLASLAKHELQQQKGETVTFTQNFVLVGGLITIGEQGRAAMTTKYLDKRVGSMIAATQSINQIPVTIDQRIHMLAAMACTRTAFGAELVDLRSKDKKAMHGAATWCIWQGKRWMRSGAITLTVVAHGHLLDPLQQHSYAAMRTMRRLLLRRPDLWTMMKAIWELRKCKQLHNDVPYGPGWRIQSIATKLKWCSAEEPWVYITADAVKFGLLEQADGWWLHALREELRTARWKGDAAAAARDDMAGTENGINYACTAALLRSTKKVGGRKVQQQQLQQQQQQPILTAYEEMCRKEENEYSVEALVQKAKLAHEHFYEDEVETEDEGKPKAQPALSRIQRALLRVILTGSVYTWHRLHRAGKAPSPHCPFCKKKESETAEHLFWECEAWKELRKEYEEEFGIVTEPMCLRVCGILPEIESLRKAQHDIDEHEVGDPMPPLREEGETADETHDDDGFLVTASDGACPSQQVEYRIARCGSGLFYGTSHAYNCSWKGRTYTQTAQRAEVRACVRWVRWAWCKTVLWTDAMLVVDGMANLAETGRHGMSMHCDLWDIIEAGFLARGGSQFYRCVKVKGHAKLKDVQGDTLLEEKRRRNNEADKLAVAGAQLHAIPVATVITIRREKLRVMALQRMMVQILEERRKIVQIHGYAALDMDDDGNEINNDDDATPPAEETESGPPVTPGMPAEQAVELIGMRRSEIFPGYDWDESTAASTVCAKPKMPERVHFQEWRYEHDLLKALVWYWERVEWHDEGAGTTWLELAIDFKFSTHVAVSRTTDETESEAQALAKFFSNASRTMAGLCRCNLAPTPWVPFCRKLHPLGMPVMAGTAATAKLLNHSAVQKTLLRQAVHVYLGSESTTRFHVQWGTLPPPMWDGGHSIDVQMPKKRISASKEEERIAAKHVRQEVLWTEDQRQTLITLNRRDRLREEKRILHNLQAEAQRQHILKPFFGVDGVGCKLVCEKCQGESPIAQLSTCPLKSCAGKVMSTTLKMRIERVTDHNKVADEKKLHIVPVPTSLDEETACERPGCATGGCWRRIGIFLNQCCRAA